MKQIIIPSVSNCEDDCETERNLDVLEDHKRQPKSKRHRTQAVDDGFSQELEFLHFEQISLHESPGLSQKRQLEQA